MRDTYIGYTDMLFDKHDIGLLIIHLIHLNDTIDMIHENCTEYSDLVCMYYVSTAWDCRGSDG